MTVEQFVINKEKKGRDKLIKLFQAYNIRYKSSLDLKSVYDGTITGITGSKTYLVEVKDRQDHYSGNSMLIEKKKYINLRLERINNKADGILYIFCFNDGIYNIVDITNYNPTKWDIQEHKVNSYSNNIINKEVGYITNYKQINLKNNTIKNVKL